MSGRPAIAVVHYHLRPGGVTRVIERAVEAVGRQADVAVLAGEPPAPASALAPLTCVFSSLGYSDRPVADAQAQAGALRAAARKKLGREPDVWHIHNAALGKNSFLPQFAWRLAATGDRLLLQPHDFAEDGRPENYRLLREHLGDSLEEILYPAADHVWYAPINHRDKAFLEEIGLRRVHALPNAVDRNAPAPGEGVSAGRRRSILYPARAIRRKNMGEFLLWSLLAPEGCRFVSTLAPQNPRWQAIYEGWTAFARELGLPVEFDAGRTHDFGALVRDAGALITTSIAEGFGLAFLEPWIEGKMLVGRKLPEITADFEQEGLDLSTLYDTLPVPLAWAGEAQFLQTLEDAMRNSYAAYSRPWRPEWFQQACAALVTDGRVDFGVLDEPLQRNVVRHLAEHPADRGLLPSFEPDGPEGLVERNRRMVEQRYGLAAYGERLMHLYRTLADTPAGNVSSADASGLLDRFLRPHRFNLLRT